MLSITIFKNITNTLIRAAAESIPPALLSQEPRNDGKTKNANFQTLLVISRTHGAKPKSMDTSASLPFPSSAM